MHLPRLPVQPRETPAQKVHRRRKNKRLLRRLFLVVCFLMVLGVGVFLGLGVVPLVADGWALKNAGESAKTALENGDVHEAQRALGETVTKLHEVRADLNYFSFVENLPWAGDQFRGAVATLDAAGEAADALYDGLGVFLGALASVEGASGLIGGVEGGGETRSFNSLSPEDKYVLLHSLAVALPELRRMQVNLRLAQRDLDRLHTLRLTPLFANAVLPLQEKLPELIDAVDIIVPFAGISPEFAGLGADRQFLTLFFNNHELRPGGGFIGNYGLLIMRDADIKSLKTDDSYVVDALVKGKPDYHVEPPKPIHDRLIQEWYFRDSAWSPDFSQTSRDASQLLRQEFAYGRQPVPEIHGVIGITTDFMSRILAFLGPITVDGQTFDAENVTDKLEYTVEQAFDCANAPKEERATCVDIPEGQRKEIIKKMSVVMVDELKSLSPSQWPDFFKVLHIAFAKKEIVLMSFDPNTEALLEDAGWGGVLNPAIADDVLMTVDSNMGAYKTDRVVDRHVTYTVRPHGSGFRATTSIKFTNTAKKRDYRTKEYKTYTRVFAPLGSTFVSSSGSVYAEPKYNPNNWEDTVDTLDDLGMTSFGGFTYVGLNSTRTLSFTYDLPQGVADAIKRGDYSLAVFKQVGARDNLLTLDIDFGRAVSDAEPAEDQRLFGDSLYRVDSVIDTDKTFRVRL